MGEKFIPYEKRSKKEKKKSDQKRRLDWGQVNPMTITHKDSRDYDRQKAKQELVKQLSEEE